MCSGFARTPRIPLHAAVQHFGKLGDLRNLAQRCDARILQHPEGPAGRNNLDPLRRESAGELDDSCFIGGAQQSALNARHGPSIVPCMVEAQQRAKGGFRAHSRFARIRSMNLRARFGRARPMGIAMLAALWFAGVAPAFADDELAEGKIR
jgi:hypothetical protein